MAPKNWKNYQEHGQQSSHVSLLLMKRLLLNLPAVQFNWKWLAKLSSAILTFVFLDEFHPYFPIEMVLHILVFILSGIRLRWMQLFFSSSLQHTISSDKFQRRLSVDSCSDWFGIFKKQKKKIIEGYNLLKVVHLCEALHCKSN